MYPDKLGQNPDVDIGQFGIACGKWVAQLAQDFEGAKGNRTQGQTGFGASRRLNHRTIVFVFAGGYGNGRHNTLPGCQKYKPFRL